MYDPVLLQTFITVAQTLNFTEAARRLGLRQSTVSQHVRRLEDAVGRPVFARDTHSVDLTEDGEAFLGFARTILEAHQRAAAFFARAHVRGRVRFGVSEDFVLTGLPEILNVFRHRHPEVDLELSVEMSGILHQQRKAGQLDLILAKRSSPHATGGLTAWQDQMVWVGTEGLRVDPERPVPLIVCRPPSIGRARALEALERAGREWQIVCTSGSVSGLLAAARAGIGVMAHTLGLIPPGLSQVPQHTGILPELGETEFALFHCRRNAASPHTEAASALADTIISNSSNFSPATRSNY
ncbi:LysR substrate-binding domain-containing protein [Streptomyces sioyaensis]|uniref:LysR substrate-binding domain-containing protein n=1 Tax=Streptomyces sioyaensis TaxID=67364 RepID=UPI0037CDD261